MQKMSGLVIFDYCRFVRHRIRVTDTVVTVFKGEGRINIFGQLKSSVIFMCLHTFIEQILP